MIFIKIKPLFTCIKKYIKKINIKSVSIGYYSLCSVEFIYSIKMSGTVKKPDFVGCPNIAKEMLIKQGILKERLIVTSDLQREKFLIKFTKKIFQKISLFYLHTKIVI